MKGSTSQQPFEFRHTEFEVRKGDLQLFQSERITILVGSAPDRIVRKIAQVTFSRRDGSIFVQFPYFSDPTGIVSTATITRPDSTGVSQIDYGERGYTTSHLVKYSHHPDGAVHFSQDGKVFTTVRRRSFPLTSEGHLFELHAHDPSGFEAIQSEELKRKRLYTPYVFTEPLPPGITVNGAWWSQSRLRQIATNRGSPIRPLDVLPRWQDGKPFKAFLVSPPATSPFADKVLVLNAGAVPEVKTSCPSMLFIGGWDQHPPGQTPGVGDGFLTFVYSAESGKGHDLESIDLRP